jgi:hypothetical protein
VVQQSDHPSNTLGRSVLVPQIPHLIQSPRDENYRGENDDIDEQGRVIVKHFHNLDLLVDKSVDGNGGFLGRVRTMGFASGLVFGRRRLVLLLRCAGIRFEGWWCRWDRKCFLNSTSCWKSICLSGRNVVMLDGML